jgi:cardiolipin synthase
MNEQALASGSGPGPGFLRHDGAGGWPCGGDAGRRRLLEIARDAGLELAHARSLALCHSGDAHFERLLAAIGGAEREVAIEMYQIRPDPVGWRVCAALAAAAARGVAVRLLVDRFGSSRVAPWLDTLAAHGVVVRWYRPWRPWANPFHRTHRKLLIADGRLASIGGINLAAEFSETFAGHQAWRDVGMWIEGPAAWRLRRQFDLAWTANGGAPGPAIAVPDGSGALCALAGPRSGDANQDRAYLALTASAEHELLFATPYFLPDRRLRDELLRAARRGVRVTVVVPRRNDIWWFKHGARRRYEELLAGGVAIWERCDRMVHAKVAVVDRLVAAAGSTNLNRLSFHGNSETLLLTDARPVVSELHALVNDESLHAAERLSPRAWPGHPDRRPLAELLASPAALLL